MPQTKKEETKVAGLIAIGELTCDECGRVIRYPERYGQIMEPGAPPRRFCTECSRAKGYLRRRKDDKEYEMETFL